LHILSRKKGFFNSLLMYPGGHSPGGVEEFETRSIRQQLVVTFENGLSSRYDNLTIDNTAGGSVEGQISVMLPLNNACFYPHVDQAARSHGFSCC